MFIFEMLESTGFKLGSGKRLLGHVELILKIAGKSSFFIVSYIMLTV